MVVFGSPKRWDRWHSPSPNWQYIPLIYHIYHGWISKMGWNGERNYLEDHHDLRTFQHTPKGACLVIQNHLLKLDGGDGGVLKNSLLVVVLGS